VLYYRLGTKDDYASTGGQTIKLIVLIVLPLMCVIERSNGNKSVAQWLRCCATSRKVAGSIPAGVSGFFFDIKSFRSHYGSGVDSAS
jgi:hypothetical protein